MNCFTAFFRAQILCALLTAGICAQAQDVRLSEVRRLPSGAVEVTITGTSAEPVVLEATSDLKIWQDLQTLTLGDGRASYVDSQAASVRERSYRVRSGARAA